MAQDLKIRTKQFSIDCWKLCRNFPNSREYNAYVNQLIRCSSSVGANYRASQRGKSTADFINKLKIVEEEADESHFFLELLFEIYDLKDDSVKIEINRLLKEANELVSIMVASINTAKNKLNNSK